MSLSTTHPPEGHSAHGRINIANLDPHISTSHDSHIEATVALVWPYSSSHGVLSLLLADRDVRLRKVTGQVKVTFHGRCAKEVAKTQVGIGDLVLLDLGDVAWTQAGDNVSTPGKKVSYNLEYSTGLKLEVIRGTQESTLVHVTATSPSPPPAITPMLDFSTPRTTRVIDVSRTRFSGSYHQSGSTPSNRVSSGSFLDASLDPFAEDDGYIVGKGRKRTKYARRSGAWTLVEGAEEVKTGPPAVQTTDQPDNQLSEALQTGNVGHDENEDPMIAEVGPTEGRHSPIISETRKAATHPTDEPADIELVPVSVDGPDDQEEMPTELIKSPVPSSHSSPPSQLLHSDQSPQLFEHTGSFSPILPPKLFAKLPTSPPPIQQQAVYVDVSPDIAIAEILPLQLLEELRGDLTVGTGPVPNGVDEVFLMNTSLTSGLLLAEEVDHVSTGEVSVESVGEEINTSPPRVPVASDVNIFQSSEDKLKDAGVIGNISVVSSEMSPSIQGDVSVADVDDAETLTADVTSELQVLDEDYVDLDALQRRIDDQVEEDLFTGTPDAVIDDEDVYNSPALSSTRETEPFEMTFVQPIERLDKIIPEEPSATQPAAPILGLEESRLSNSRSVPEYPYLHATDQQLDVATMENEEQQTPIVPHTAAITRIESPERLEALELPSSPPLVAFENLEESQIVDSRFQPHATGEEADQSLFEDSSSSTTPERSEEVATQLDFALEAVRQRRASIEFSDGEGSSLQEQPLRVDQDMLADTAAVPDVPHEEVFPLSTALTVDDLGRDQILTPPATQQSVLAESRAVRFQVQAAQDFPLSPSLTQRTAEADAATSLTPYPDPKPIAVFADIHRVTMNAEPEIKPRRVSQRLTRKSFASTDIDVEDFAPQREEQVQNDQSPPPEDDIISQEDASRPTTPVQSHSMPITKTVEVLPQQSPQVTEDSVQGSRESSILLGGTTTSLSYFPHLATLEEHFSQLVDVMAVCTSPSDPVQRAKSGPKDYYTTLHLSDMSFTDNATRTAQIFRPRKTALPVANRGDVILLRDMKVQSKDHKPLLLSVETSSWATFSPTSDTFHVSMNGPPVEYGDTEIARCEGLVQWWGKHSKNYPEPQAGMIPPTSPRLTRSQLRKSSVFEKDIAPIDTTEANDHKADNSETHDKLTPLVQSFSSQAQPDLPSPTRSMVSASNRTARRRSSRRSESIVHELRDGTKYVDDDDGNQVLIHELRDGLTYIDN